MKNRTEDSEPGEDSLAGQRDFLQQCQLPAVRGEQSVAAIGTGYRHRHSVGLGIPWFSIF